MAATATALYPHLSENATREIQKIMDYPMNDVVTRFAAEHDTTMEIAREHERELKRFLALCLLYPDKHFSPSMPVDEMWHTFILDTRKYNQFCEVVCGRFIHHEPGEPAEGEYEQFYKGYSVIFGENPPVQVWPGLARAGELITDCRGPASCKHGAFDWP
jgi:hypothetical protein